MQVFHLYVCRFLWHVNSSCLCMCETHQSHIASSWHPFHFQCPPYVWLAFPSQQKVLARGYWWCCRGGWREKCELHLFNLYILFALHFWVYNFYHTHRAHSSCLCCPPPSPLQVGHTSWVRQRLKQGPLGVVVVSSWLSVHSCICMCV